MVEALDLLRLIESLEKESGMVSKADLHAKVPQSLHEALDKLINTLAREGKVYEPMEGYFRVAEPTAQETMWFDPEVLDWGKPITPASPSSRKKGPYYISHDEKNKVYQELRKLVLKEISNGGHSIISSGYNYWLDPIGRGIARRKVKIESIHGNKDDVKEIKDYGVQ